MSSLTSRVFQLDDLLGGDARVKVVVESTFGCPFCGKLVQVGRDGASGCPLLAHDVPQCSTFDDLGVVEFLEAANARRRRGVGVA